MRFVRSFWQRSWSTSKAPYLARHSRAEASMTATTLPIRAAASSKVCGSPAICPCANAHVSAINSSRTCSASVRKQKSRWPATHPSWLTPASTTGRSHSQSPAKPRRWHEHCSASSKRTSKHGSSKFASMTLPWPCTASIRATHYTARCTRSLPLTRAIHPHSATSTSAAHRTFYASSDSANSAGFPSTRTTATRR